ncbi:MAG: C1 family peptidase [bacterium]|nr:C1 family peptidase [bacterium]
MTQETPGMGWLPDLPNIHDKTHEHNEVAALLAKFKLQDKEKKKKLPPKVDLKQWFAPILNQEKINACTAFASTALVEYYEKRAFGNTIEGSRMFLYKITKNLLQLTGNVGVYPRTAMEALALFGTPPEKYWPYDADKIDTEPTAFCYAFADNYKAIDYYRLDSPTCQTQDLVDTIKIFLAHGLPPMIGITIYSSLLSKKMFMTGVIPFPGKNEKIVGGHCVALAGYDDTKKISNLDDPNATPTTGAFLLKNSWGTQWGTNGYGWLPYEYALKGIVKDCWMLIKSNWLDTEQFGKI